MLKLKKISSLSFVFLMVITGVFAQMPQNQAQPKKVNAREIAQFATALVKIQSIEEQVQGKMVDAVQKAGIEVQRFNEIYKAQQDPNQKVDATKEELEQFSEANQSIGNIQNEAQQEMQKVVIDNKLTVNRYQEIMAAVQNDPELQHKLQKHMEN